MTEREYLDIVRNVLTPPVYEALVGAGFYLPRLTDQAVKTLFMKGAHMQSYACNAIREQLHSLETNGKFTFDPDPHENLSR